MRPPRGLRAGTGRCARPRVAACACLVAFAVAFAAAGPPINAQVADTLDVASSLRALVASVTEAPLRPAPSSNEALGEFYARRDWSTAWIADGRLTPQAAAVIDFLGRAQEVGLDPEDYDAQGLHDWATRIAGAPASLTEQTRFDVSLSRSLLLLLHHLSEGRVDPQSIGFSLPRPGGIDLAGVARDVSRAVDVSAAIRQVEPQYAGYRALEQALTRYQALAADSTLRTPYRPRRSVRPDESYAEMPALRRLLVAFGDLVDTTTGSDTAGRHRYTPEMVAAVERFQERHGLEPDGIIGPSTFAALRVPIAERVVQMELSLERWRWLPRRPPQRYVAINIPAFRLYAFEGDSTAAHAVLDMKVILGASQMRRATPVFEGTMRQIVFRPYWDVPRSIASKELIPLIRPDTGYAVHQSLEIVRGSDDHARIYPLTPENLQRVAAGTLRLRQRPGSDNALGLIKFVFPNAHNVYLHGTPATELFAHARRDFSHGCIRVEDPAALAHYALGGQDGWTPPEIAEAMHGAEPLTVSLARPVEVFILYATSVVSRTGVISFYPDLYGHDTALARALEQRSARAALSRPFAEDR